MTPEQFDAANAYERNSEIAFALGWERSKDGYWIPPMYVGTNAVRGVDPAELDRMGEYDWQGDDGRAFKELWPEVSRIDVDLCIKVSGTFENEIRPCVVKFQFGEGISVLRKVSVGDTWALAICKAFLTLKNGGTA